ncbi:zinc-binding dehydrogenase [Kineococcus sp. T13]|uniref:zinc-dependent alcohol dehydrogenase n=1 Tax=Kineococcus vitellinus TaxID=2696565 RepID=UPI0014133313|nr:zinc-binding alcohol dehydrogenase [Kineococcus vitellinus]NAZ76603.1 zinc-binding dehydrogenase [Kineococcus vitellinus]
MPRTVQFTAARTVDVVDAEPLHPAPGQVRVATLSSGISAGTEMTAYRGTNPYLTSTWDPGLRLFTVSHPERPSYPLLGWGYSEVGRVVEVVPAATTAGTASGTTGPGAPGDVRVGDLVWGIWGHRSEAVLPAADLRGHRLPDGLDPVAGCFVRVGAIALNAVLAADAGLGDTVAVVGQGVIGLLATRFAVLSGARVVAVEGVPARRERALGCGAAHALEPGPATAAEVRELTGGRGADVAIDLSGAYPALHEATRLVGADGRVVAAGFYQGEAAGLRLGEEFHHNRVEVVASQIGAVPSRKRARWDVARLQETVVGLIAAGRVDVAALVSHRFDVEDAAAAYDLLDTRAAQALQVVLDFPRAGEGS